NSSELEGNVDGRVRGDLQRNSGLDVCAEAFLFDFEPIGADGEVREHIAAVLARSNDSYCAGRCLCGLHFGSGNGRAGGVLHRTLDLSCVLSLRPQSGNAKQAKDNYTQASHHKDLLSGNSIADSQVKQCVGSCCASQIPSICTCLARHNESTVACCRWLR